MKKPTDKMKISTDHLEKLKNLIDEAESIGIASHVNPDGDNLGSSLGFARILRNYGKNVDVIGHDEIDDYLKFMPDLEYYNKDYKDSYDLFLILDASEMERIGTAIPIAEASDKTAVIDHHTGGGITSDLNIIHPDAPATCELIYEISERLGFVIDKTAASLLYTGIVTDTGRFLYYNTSQSTFDIASNLLALGADKDYIYSSLYQNKPIKVFKFENFLINRAEFMGDRVFTYATIEDTEELGVQMGDSESVANMLRDLEGIEISMLMKQYGEREFKISMRSKTIDISKAARENDGGGHINAAGFTIWADDYIKAKDKAIEILKNIND